MSGRSGGPRPGPGGRTKSGKPRPGTGGYGKRKLEGKGPTPPAAMRPGHPAQRRATQAARGASQPSSRADRPAADGRAGASSRGAGSAAEVVAGRNAVLEALRARVPASALHVGPRLDSDERIGEAVMLAADHGIPVVEAGRSELDRMTGGAIHQGLALKVAPYQYAAPGDLIEAAADAAAQPLIVALDGVTDPRNLGAIARSVAAFGGHGILVPVRRSAGVTAGAWKASAGALARVRVAQASNLAQALAAYQQAGLFVVGLDAAGAEDIGQLELADSPLVLVVGGEGRGLSRLIAERCDAVAQIPITSGAESLNAGVAASIALYAVSRQRA
ncbi:MAG TPA: 23S rRNA (guanosine(2251)-2'-O)-methyltransferase RlmB [Streptosporangiaceae bacterium]|jgi:23S rRNA (guanosine2251-2'-O)-methyltransferase|nr:23S rRNA (guanosine(2251)-2'-O)-methyltransferase RlmB [Streptosporangiaceae bacterium]